MSRLGNDRLMVESRMFWLRFIVDDNDMPMLEKLVEYDTEDVRVDCVRVCGLYIEFRLFGS